MISFILALLIPYYGTPIPEFSDYTAAPFLSHFTETEESKKEKNKYDVAYTISVLAQAEKFPPSIVNKIAFYESSYNPLAVGKAGEKGLYQFKQATWDFLSKQSGITGDPFDIEDSTKMFIWAWNNGYRKWWSTSKFVEYLNSNTPEQFQRKFVKSKLPVPSLEMGPGTTTICK